MAGVKRNINYSEGDTFSYLITFQNADGTAINKTGKTYDFIIKDTANGSTLVSETGTTPSNPTGGIVTITVSAATMAALSEGTSVYSIKENDGSAVYTKLYGNFLTINTP